MIYHTRKDFFNGLLISDISYHFSNSIINKSVSNVFIFQATTTLTTNDIVINKLTQILSYLRQGRRESKKLKKKEKGG